MITVLSILFWGAKTKNLSTQISTFEKEWLDIPYDDPWTPEP